MPVKKIVGVAVFFLSLVLGHIAHFSAINSLNVPLIILLQGTALALLSRHILTVACCTLLFCLFGVYCPQQARITDTLLLYVVPLGALLGTFACSLLPAHTPLISRVAQQVHGPLRADVARYTRFLTLFWALFFAGALLAPAVLALAGPDGSWRWPLSGGTFACAAGVMLVEAYVRRRVIRNFEHVSLRETVSAFRKASSRPTSG